MAEKNLVGLPGKFDHLKGLKKNTTRVTNKINISDDGGAYYKEIT
jgi:hypothetical protein